MNSFDILKDHLLCEKPDLIDAWCRQLHVTAQECLNFFEVYLQLKEAKIRHKTEHKFLPTQRNSTSIDRKIQHLEHKARMRLILEKFWHDQRLNKKLKHKIYPTENNHLQQYRESNFLSQDYLAEKTGLCRETIINIETFHYKKVHISTIIKLSKALRVPPSTLFPAIRGYSRRVVMAAQQRALQRKNLSTHSDLNESGLST